MKHFILKISLALNPIFLFGQEINTVVTSSLALDTVSVYDCNYTIRREGGTRSYTVNGKSVTKEEFQLLNIGFQRRKTCNPCYLKQISLDEKLLSEGIYYYNCPNAGPREEEEVSKNINNSKTIRIKVQSCKEGVWLFYNKQGEIEKKEVYKLGKLQE